VIFFLTLKFSRKNFSNNTEHGVLEQIGHNVVRHLLHTKNDVLAVTGTIGSFGGSALHMLQGTFKRASSSNFSCKSLPRENNWYELENSVCTIGSTVEAVEIMIGGGILKRPASSRSLVLRLKLYLIAKLKKSTKLSTDTCGGTIGKSDELLTSLLEFWNFELFGHTNKCWKCIFCNRFWKHSKFSGAKSHNHFQYIVVIEIQVTFNGFFACLPPFPGPKIESTLGTSSEETLDLRKGFSQPLSLPTDVMDPEDDSQPSWSMWPQPCPWVHYLAAFSN